MRNTYLVMRQELIAAFSRRSYLLFAFGIPILVMLIMAGVQYLQDRSPGQDAAARETAGQSPDNLVIEGYVDHSGIIHAIPKGIPADRLLAYPDEEHAQAALEAGEISAYYLVPADYIEQGKVYYVYPDSKSYLSDGQAWVIQWVLTTNLLQDDLELADLVWNPVWYLNETNLTAQSPAGMRTGEDCSRPGSACRSNEFIRFMPALMVILLFIALMVSSSMLFNSIGIEKENRTIEVLLLSINTRQLLSGKTLALGIAGLVQTTVWMCTAYILFNLGGAALNLPENFTFPAGIFVWSLVFFLGGYLLYASLMAGAGALVPRMKETGIVNAIVMTPLFIGYMIGLYAPLGGATEASLPVVMSLVPFTAPVVMLMRLADGIVPLWQPLLSAGLVFLTAYYTLRTVARMFRAQVLLSGQHFSLGRYLRLLAGRV